MTWEQHKEYARRGFIYRDENLSLEQLVELDHIRGEMKFKLIPDANEFESAMAMANRYFYNDAGKNAIAPDAFFAGFFRGMFAERQKNEVLAIGDPLIALLRKARASLAEGLETPNDSEPEYQQQDRTLIAEIDQALQARGV